uniref:Uncharacterized protein n=1 Tax=Arundo donax TaxID=35708 RepID=A0A0A9FJD9_ARUDO
MINQKLQKRKIGIQHRPWGSTISGSIVKSLGSWDSNILFEQIASLARTTAFQDVMIQLCFRHQISV